MTHNTSRFRKTNVLGLPKRMIVALLLVSLILPVAHPARATETTKANPHTPITQLVSTQALPVRVSRPVWALHPQSEQHQKDGSHNRLAAGIASVLHVGSTLLDSTWRSGGTLLTGLTDLLNRVRAPGQQRLSVSQSPASQITTTVFVGSIDVGNVRIWYNNGPLYSNGTYSITDGVGIGPITDNTPYYLADGAQWQSSGAITLSGNLQTLSNTDFYRGTVIVDRTTGTMTPQTDVVRLLNKIGSSKLSIDPTISASALRPELQVTAALSVTLPENTIQTEIDYVLNTNGTITDTSSISLSLTLAGASLNADLFITNNGLEAKTAKLSIPRIDTKIELKDLVIDGDGELGLHFGGSATFPIPDIDLGNGVLVLKNLQASLKLNPNKQYEIEFTDGSVQINNLSENNTLSADVKAIKIAAGRFVGSVSDLKVAVAGLSLTMHNASLDDKDGAYVLKAATADLSVPGSWTSGAIQPTIDLQEVKIKNSAPYLDIGGGGLSFSTNKSFTLGGGGGSAEVVFDQISGQLQDMSSKWIIQLSSRITFTFGASGDDKVVANGTTLTIDSGKASGSLSQLTLKIASMDLDIETLSYNDSVFTAGRAILTLPNAWQGASFEIDGVQIDKSSLKLGGADGQFGIPDQNFGSVVKLSGMSANLKVDPADNDYAVVVTATVQIGKAVNPSSGNQDLTVKGNLAIKDGSVTGTVDEFSFQLSGLTFSAYDVGFQNDTLFVGAAAIELPPSISNETNLAQPKCPPDGNGSPGAVVCSLQIGAAGFSLGGAQIKLPDFTVASIGVSNATAFIVHNTVADSYTVGGNATFEFVKFTVEGSFSFDYQVSTKSLKLNSVGFDFQGSVPEPSIPLGATGFALTGISGSVDLTSGSTTVELGIVASSELFVSGQPLLNLNGTVTLQVSPFDLQAGVSAALLGRPLAQVNININDRAFTLNGSLGNDIANISLFLAFGNAFVETCTLVNGVYTCGGQNELTFFGKAQVNVTIPRGYFFDKWYAPDIPPFDITAQGSLEAGKYTANGQEIWGAQGSFSAYGFDVDGYAIFSPNFSSGLGDDLSGYTPVIPTASLFGVQSLGITQRTVTFTKPHRYLLIAEAITNSNSLAQDMFTAINPAGKPVTSRLVHVEKQDTRSVFRLYRINLEKPEDALGAWTFSFRQGNLLKVKGAKAGPRLQSASACAGSTCLAPDAQLTLTEGQPLTIGWDARGYTKGLSVRVLAESQNGQRHVIVHHTTEANTTLSGSKIWQPFLASGVYTLTVLLSEHMTSGQNGFTSALVRKDLGQIRINNTAPPVAPAGLQATPLPERAAQLRWTPPSDGDIAGYRIWVDSTASITVGRLIDNYIVHGLTPGRSHTLSVAAYDLSGNIGPAQTVAVQLPRVSVEALWPGRNHRVKTVSEVGISFNTTVSQVNISVTDGLGREIPGQLQLITHRRHGTVVTIGAIFKPTGGLLPKGVYTVRASAVDQTSQTSLAATWSFRAVPAHSKLYLPVMRIRR